ncbi:MAG: hypothetical protein ACE5HU_05275 [Acidobacteriota bacterium]
MILLVMQTMGTLLAECAARLAPFERRRVGRLGCLVCAIAAAAALASLLLGVHDAGGSWARGFRFVVSAGLASAILVFLVAAAAETFVERAVTRRIERYLRETGQDMRTLLSAAEMRRSQTPGAERILVLLRDHCSHS